MDAGSAIEAPGYPNATGRYARRDPPWTVEAWVRRDDSLVEQTLFAGPDGASVALELGPATGKVGVVTPADFAAVTSARRAFADARNNTAAESAAERVRAALAQGSACLQIERLDAILRDGARRHRALDERGLLEVPLEALE